MSCKFHPAAEAVTTCGVCGAEICSVCAKGAFYENDDKPVCLECSLKGAEEELTLKKMLHKSAVKIGIIASIIWIVGACLIPLGGFGILLMLIAAIVYCKGALFASDERGFFEKIKDIFWNFVVFTLLCPIFVIVDLIRDKKEVTAIAKKVEKIKAALGNVSR